MSKTDSEVMMDARRLCVLNKLYEVPVANFLELGFNASPLFLRNMAARGLVRITVEITPRGRETIGKLKDKALQRKAKIAKARHKQLTQRAA